MFWNKIMEPQNSEFSQAFALENIPVSLQF